VAKYSAAVETGTYK